jgi:hypothetical protein
VSAQARDPRLLTLLAELAAAVAVEPLSCWSCGCSELARGERCRACGVRVQGPAQRGRA